MKLLTGKRQVTSIAMLAGALLLALAISVTALPPIANDDSYTTNENTPLVIPTPGVLANDSDPDGDPLIAVLDSPPANGDLSLNPDGGFVYTPSLNFNGVDTFTYLAADGDLAAVAHWRFDDGTNPTADVSGNGYDAVLSGTVAFSATVPVTLGAGLSLEFDGVNGSSDVQATGIDLANQSFSVAAWARREPAGGNRYLVTQGTPPGGNYHNLHVGFRDNAQFTCAFWGDDLDTPQPYPETNWHHWACTYDAGSNQRTIYRDGVPVASDTAGADYQGTGPLHIGNTFGTVDCFPGLIDDVRIYDQPLTQPEIQAIMQGIPSADRATVSITVTGVNEPPLPMDDSYEPPIDGVFSLPAPGVLDNDEDPDGDVLTATLLTPPANGDLSLNLDGSFVYTPTPGFEGLDGFVYQASDGQLAESASVSLSLRHRRITHSATRADQPDVAIDASGNVHIAYTDEYTTSGRELWYTMLDNDGHTLIDDTRLTADDGHESTRPAILVDSENKVHILWHDQRWDGGSYQEVTYTKLDPYLDDMDGSPAISGTITLVDDTRTSHNNERFIFGVRTALDSDDDIHIVWDSTDDVPITWNDITQDPPSIYYKKIDANGDELVPETMIRSADFARTPPYLALDSSDNLHLTWADSQDTGSAEIYYMMLDNLGSILIDATSLTPDDGMFSWWPSIVVDAENKVHIAWEDSSGEEEEIWSTKLDPYLDDQDGDPADEAAITLIPDTPLTPDDGIRAGLPTVAIDGRILHINWEVSENIHYSVLNNNGYLILDDYPLTTGDTVRTTEGWTKSYMAIDQNGRMHTVWCDSRDGAYEVYYTHHDWTYGHLDGHVYDAATLDPIEGATVSAGAGADSDASGYYTMTTPVGVYTATAQHPWYASAYQPNVEIITDSLTSLDWYLTARGRLYGYIIDYDTGLPLEADLNVLGFGSTTSDPDTGYYEIYLDPGTYNLEATAPNYLTGTATVEIVSGQQTQQDFSLAYSLALAPYPLHVTLDWQTTASFPATLTNRLPVDYAFVFSEYHEDFVPRLLGGGEHYVLAPPNVLIARADHDAEPLLSLLGAYGDLGALDDLDVRAYTPILADLLPYDVVITWGDACYQDPEAMGDVLADYVDAGGRVLNLMHGMQANSCRSVGGRYWDEDYTGLKASGGAYSTDCLGAYDIGHPIMAGVTDACAYYRLSGTYLTPDSHEVAQFSDGSTFVAAKHDHSVVNLVANMGDTGWSGQAPDMVHNAILWQNTRPDLPWLGEEPISGTIPAESSLGVTVFFSATYAAGVDQPGDYSAVLATSYQPNLKTLARMTVLPPADMGKVEGYVRDRCLGEPVEADVYITGGAPITETATHPDGYYAAWLFEGGYELTFSADGYLTHTASLSLTAGATTSLDVDLFPDRPCIQVEPDGFEVWLLNGTPVYTHPAGVDLVNLGGQDLEFELAELEGRYLTPTLPSQILASRALLIQDAPPWGYDAWGDIMTAYGIPFDVIPSNQISTTDFSAYKIIAIPSAQGSAYNTTFNDNLAQFETFIDDGGVLLMSFCTQFSHTPYIQPPFGGTNHYETDSDNYIETPNHFIFTGVPNPYSGAIASQNYLSDLLPGDRVLVTQGTTPDGNVVMIEREHGQGLLLAGGQFFEVGWGQGYDQGTILENMIFYYYFVYENDVPWLWEEPASGTLPTNYTPLSDLNVEIAFSALYTDATPMPLGTYSATLFVLHNDPVTQVPMLPVTMHVVEDYVTPTASFTSDSPTCLGASTDFTNTTSGGVPPASLFQWQFGDGVTSTLQHPSHVYGAVGAYTVTLTACSPEPYNLCDIYQGVVEVLPPPTASFDYVVDDLTVQFSNTSANTDSYLWDLGDGTTSTETHPVHTYTTSDTFTVVLEASSACGTDAFTDTVTTQAPSVCQEVTGVSLSYTNTTPIYPSAGVYFQADVAPDSFSPPYTYTIDYGDGTVENGAGGLDPLALNHSYAATGTYTAQISLWNCAMAQPVVDAVQVTVYEPGTCVDLSGVDLSLVTTGTIYAGDSVQFSADLAPDQASKPYTYTVLLDGGEIVPPTSGSDDPLTFNHTFPNTGTFSVEVRARNCAMAQPVTGVIRLTVYEPGTCVDLSGVELSLLTAGQINPGDQVDLRAVLSPAGASLPYTYTLNYGDGSTPVSGSSNNTPFNFSYTYAATGTYTLSFEAWNCAMTQPVTDSLQVVVVEPAAEDHTIYLPVVLKN